MIKENELAIKEFEHMIKKIKNAKTPVIYAGSVLIDDEITRFRDGHPIMLSGLLDDLKLSTLILFSMQDRKIEEP